MTWEMRLGDCLDPAAGLASLPDRSIDVVVTDPPYAITQEGVWHVGARGKGKRRFDFFEGDADWRATTAFVVRAAEECIRLAKRPGSAYWWCGHREFGPLVSLYESRGWATRLLVWAKSAPPLPPPGSGWPSGAELCVYAFERGRTWNHGGSNPPPNNVFRLDSFRHGQPGKVNHPTQKPEALINPLIFASSHPGDTILDPFAGSGTTGIAAIHLGRNFIGWERDPKYHALAARRLSSAREQLTLGDARKRRRAVQISLW